MASRKKDNISSKSNETAPEVLKVLTHLFGDVLHTDVIRSVALNCQWNLDTASNILAELTSSVTNDKVTSKPKKLSSSLSSSASNLNTVGYAGDDDNDVDVLIEGESNQGSIKHAVNYRSAFSEAVKKKVVNVPKKNKTPPEKNVLTLPNRPATPKSIQNKSKRELEYERVRDHILTGAKVLVLLRGLPGSGKSFLAKMLISTTIREDHRRFVYSTDEYFERNGVYQYNPVLLQDAHGWNQRRVYEAMQLGMSPIIVDNTNTEMWEMRPYAMFAVQFGYAVEILEPNTVWIFNPPELARRNAHNVPKDKISNMLDRYEKNITPDKLFSMYNLKYMPRNHPPQPRLYPPLSKNIKPNYNIPAAIARNGPVAENPPKPKKKKAKKKKTNVQNSDSSSTLSKSESMHSILTNDDSDSDIDTLNELQKTDSGYSLNVHDVFYEKSSLSSGDAKQNRLLMHGESPLKVKKENKGEHIDLINFNDNVDNDKANQFSSDLINLDNKENNCTLENNKLTNVQDKTAQLIDSCVKLFKAVTTKDSDTNRDNNLNNSAAASTPGTYPKIDLSSWGLADNALFSWELVETPKVKEQSKPIESQPQRQTIRQSSVDSTASTSKPNDASTNTTSEDFSLLKQDVSVNSEVKIVSTTNRNILENCESIMPRRPPKISIVDKSTMTGKENVLNAALTRNRCTNDAQHFTELVNLFPNYPEDDLKDIFEKCKGDVNWAVDLLLEGNRDTLGTTEEKNHQTQASNTASAHEHTLDCSCGAEYESQGFVTSEPQPSEEGSNNDTVEIIKSPSKLKNTVSKESLELKKLLEEQFKIGDEYYSNHVSNLRKKRYGEPETVPSTSKDNTENVSPDTNLDSKQTVSDEIESEESSEEEIIEVNVGMNFVEQLERNCGFFDLDYPKGFQPVMQLPTSLVRQLHAYWLESVYLQMDTQTQIIEKMVQEDEEFARKLQEQEAASVNQSPVVPNLQEIIDMEIALAIYKADQEQWKQETPDDLAFRMKRQKLFETFPNFDQDILIEILHDSGNSFDQTVAVLMASLGENDENINKSGITELAKQKELMENAKKEYIQAKQSPPKKPAIIRQSSTDEASCCSPAKTAEQYRDEAAHHLQMRQQNFNKAHAAIQKGQTQVAMYYSEIAQMHKTKYEQANGFAAAAFLTAHGEQQNAKTLDLHYLYVKEAEQALALFIDEQISKLKAKNKLKESILIITGRGSHSRDGVSHIKPMVKRRLKERKLEYTQMNPGLLKVVINKHSIMTNDLK